MGKLLFLVLTIGMIFLAVYLAFKKYKLVQERSKVNEIDAESNWKLATDCFDKGNIQEALVYVDKVLNKFPEDVEAIELKEVILEVIKRRKIEKAIDLDVQDEFSDKSNTEG
jgi:tetratricopeptide (TPR) repeat protein